MTKVNMGEISVLRTRTHTRPVLRTILSLALGGLVLLPAAAPASADGVATNDTVSSPAAEDVVVDVLANDTGITGDDYLSVPGNTLNGAYLYVDDAKRVHFYADTEGTDSFTYTVLDGTTGDPVGAASVAITVTPALVVSARDDEYDAEKDFDTVLPVTDNDTTGAGAVGLDPSGEPSHGTLVLNQDDYQPTITYTPDTGYEGVDTFGYKLVGDQGDMDTATVTVHVKQVGVQNLDIARAWTGAHLTWQNPRSPSFTGLVARIATVADDGVDHTPQTPSDGDPVALADSATRLDLTGLGQPFTYVVSIFAHYQDGSYSEPVSREFSPGIEPVRNLHADAGNAQVTLAWTNPEGSDATKVEYDTPTGVHKTVSVSTGSATKTITGLTNGRDYTFTLTSIADGSGPAYVGDPLAIDARPRSRTNHPPVATDDLVSLVGTDPAQIDLLGNDQDADNDDLTVLSTTQPGSGAVSCATYGTCAYTPAGADPQSTTFTYVVTDSHGGRDTGTVDLRQRHVTTTENQGTATTAEVSRFDVLANDTGVLPEDTLEVDPIDPAVGTAEVTGDADDHQVVQFVPASLDTPAQNRAGLTAATVHPAILGPSGTRVEVAYRVVDDRGHELGSSVLHLLVRPPPR
jgi:Bacterial Ig domain